jgi:hypothetical protein
MTTQERDLKFHAASRAQRQEIMRHRERLCRRRKHPVSLDEAARDWIRSYAAEWRRQFEAHWRESAV